MILRVVLILVFIKQLLTEESIVSGKLGSLGTTLSLTDRKNFTGGTFHSFHNETEESSSGKSALLID